jgi:DNA-binding response OmpR family regulator
MDRNIKLILVEDDNDLRESLVECLQLNEFSVRGAASAMECYRALGGGVYDIAVVDIGLPDQDGFVLAEYLRTNTCMKIIILTARSAVEDRIKGYGSGADLYLVKPVDHRELSAAIRSLCDRESPQSPLVQTAALSDKWVLSRENWQLVAPNGAIITLTGRELQFLDVLLATPGKAVKRETLIEILGYSDIEYANRAIDSLVRRLRRKVETLSSVEPPIRTAHAFGYCFSAPVIVS